MGKGREGKERSGEGREGEERREGSGGEGIRDGREEGTGRGSRLYSGVPAQCALAAYAPRQENSMVALAVAVNL